MAVKTFKTPGFHRWAKSNDLIDEMLLKAVSEMESGLVDARLGGHLMKKRVAAAGRGKSGSYRTIVAYRQNDRLVFLYGFEKNDRDNITQREKIALLKLGDQYMSYSQTQIAEIVMHGQLIEVKDNEQDS